MMNKLLISNKREENSTSRQKRNEENKEKPPKSWRMIAIIVRRFLLVGRMITYPFTVVAESLYWDFNFKIFLFNFFRTKINRERTKRMKPLIENERWMSTRLQKASNSATRINFNDQIILQTIDSDVAKCREKRMAAIALDELHGYPAPHEYISQLGDLTLECDMEYDTNVFPLRSAFIEMLDLRGELEYLHSIHSEDVGKKGQRLDKMMLLSGMLNRDRRQLFQDAFDTFICAYIAPHLYENTQGRVVSFYYQAFPCVRVNRPGEFSIGPHCDASYGFSFGNINFYIPLTKIYGTNSLVLESATGKEDWHTIEGDYGLVKRFYGSSCSHFTACNTTDTTRVSLDFRVVPDQVWREDHDQFSSVPGYYRRCIPITDYVSDTKDNTIKWQCVGDRLVPDTRTGFPFTSK